MIVAEFFDAGQSRTVAWDRRPQAAALVALLADPGRDWDAIVIGEYERACCRNRRDRQDYHPDSKLIPASEAGSRKEESKTPVARRWRQPAPG